MVIVYTTIQVFNQAIENEDILFKILVLFQLIMLIFVKEVCYYFIYF